MENKLRIAAASPSGFRHEGFDLSDTWQEVSWAELTEEQRKALRTYQATHIKVHPDDQKYLEEQLKSLPPEPKPGATSTTTGNAPEQAAGQPKRDALSQGQPIPGQGGYETGAETPDSGTHDPSKTEPGRKPPLTRR